MIQSGFFGRSRGAADHTNGDASGAEAGTLSGLKVVFEPRGAETAPAAPVEAVAGERPNSNQEHSVGGSTGSLAYPKVDRSRRSASSRRRKPLPKRVSRSVYNPVGPEDYFRTAFDILAEQGPEALTTAHLCDRLKVTKGSFYYHFRNVDHFVEELASYRECLFSDLQSFLAAEPDPVRRLSSAVNLAVAMPHQLEVAIRAWARSNPVIGASQRRLDRDAISLLTATISGIVEDAEGGAIIGRQMVALMIGLQQLETLLDPPRAIRAVAAFLEKTCRLHASMSATDDVPTLELARVDQGTLH